MDVIVVLGKEDDNDDGLMEGRKLDKMSKTNEKSISLMGLLGKNPFFQFNSIY